MNTKLDILKKIQSGEVDMTPRWHFTLKSLLLIFSAITTTLLLIYILSFVLFALKQSGVGFIPFYGFKGLSLFVMNTPWLLIASAGALLMVLQLLVNKYSFSFRQPLLYSFIGIIILVLFGAYAIEQSKFHTRLQGFTEDRNTPVLGSMYQGINKNQPKNLVFGHITQIIDEGFILESDKGEIITTIIMPNTKHPKNKTYNTDEAVLVFGERKENIIEAFGIRPAPNNHNFTRTNDKQNIPKTRQ